MLRLRDYNSSGITMTPAVLALSGLTISGLQSVIDSWLAGFTPQYDPPFVLFNMGANDVVGTWPEATWKANLAYILDAIHTKFPRAVIYQMRSWRRGYATESDTIATWAADVRATRAPWAVTGPDERVFLEGGDDGATYTVDGVHPNAAGYALTADQWIAALGY
jgi:lysophospholipase L1-like esterase